MFHLTTRLPNPVKKIIFAELLMVVIAVGLTSFAGTAEAEILSLSAPFTVGSFETKYLNFDGTSLTVGTKGSNSVAIGNFFVNVDFYDVTINAVGANYAFDSSTSSIKTFSPGDVVSAASTDFISNDKTLLPSDSAPTYFVVGFYNNVYVTSLPTASSPDAGFVDNSNLAWVAIIRNGTNLIVQDAAVNTVAGAAITVPEPSTYAMALAGLACGGYAMVRRRRDHGSPRC